MPNLDEKLSTLANILGETRMQDDRVRNEFISVVEDMRHRHQEDLSEEDLERINHSIVELEKIKSGESGRQVLTPFREIS